MRQKIVAFDFENRAALGAWIASDGSIMVGGRTGRLKLMLDILDDPNREELRVKDRVKIRTRARKWDELVERMKASGLRVQEVRGFRRLVN